MAFGGGLLSLALLVCASHAAGATLEDVRQRGHLVCGVSEATPGFALADERGSWSGLEVDFCRAIAAAVLGSDEKVKERPVSATGRFQALTSGEIDVLARATSWTLSRDTELGVRFAGVLLYDGQGFLVRRGEAVTSVLELSGSSVCVLKGTSAEQGVVDFFRSHQMRYQRVVAERWDDLVKAYAEGRCTLLTGDASTLALERSRLANPNDHILLPELIAKEPLGPAVRQGDDQWFAIVRWTLAALVAAEELGLTSENADDMMGSPITDVRRFLGREGNLGQGMGLEPDWAYRIVRLVGSYGELFEQNLGAKSSLKLERGLNNLWTRGGLMYAPPMR
jgi:general L-amino acid transport system substrate-binding protein